MSESYDIEPWGISPGAPVPAPEYLPYYAPSKDPRTLKQRFLGSKPTLNQGWIPASKYLPEGSKSVDVYRGLRPQKNPHFRHFKGGGPWLNTNYLNKAKIIPGDWVSNNIEGAQYYARGHSKTGRPQGRLLKKNVPVKDLYVPSDINTGGDKPHFNSDPAGKMRYLPRGTSIDPNAGSLEGRLGQTGKQAHTDLLLKEAKYPKGAQNPMTKPGMITGRMPMFRGIGGGLMGMFMEGPELQEAKTDPNYGNPKAQHAWKYGI